jgi:hypothetical protein
MAADGGGTIGWAAVDRRITTWLRGLVQVTAAHRSNYWVGVVTDPAAVERGAGDARSSRGAGPASRAECPDGDQDHHREAARGHRESSARLARITTIAPTYTQSSTGAPGARNLELSALITSACS